MLAGDRTSGNSESSADRVAPGRYRPRAPTDPYVRTLAHTVPQIMVFAARLKIEREVRTGASGYTPEETPKRLPGHRAFAVAAIKPVPPSTIDFPTKA